MSDLVRVRRCLCFAGKLTSLPTAEINAFRPKVSVHISTFGVFVFEVPVRAFETVVVAQPMGSA